MPKFLSMLRKKQPTTPTKEFPYSIKIKDGVFEYGIKEIPLSRQEFLRFWKAMPKGKEIKDKEFDDVDLIENLVVPPAVYSNPLLEQGLIKKSGLKDVEKKLKLKFPQFKILETHIKALTITKIDFDHYDAQLILNGVCID